MGKEYYIASCVFTMRFPALSQVIRDYITTRWQIPIVRCCVPKYMLKEFANKLPAAYQDKWRALPDCAAFEAGDTVYSLCHNCSNIVEEMRPGVIVKSLWELILQDENFPLPNCAGLKATVQDCWRSRDRTDEQDAVRELLRKMHVELVELPDNREKTDFCGISLYRPQPPRNPAVAPKHYKENIGNKFEPHTLEEQKAIMQEYCKRYKTDTVICYCHYCLEGLALVDIDSRHIANMLFGNRE